MCVLGRGGGRITGGYSFQKLLCWEDIKFEECPYRGLSKFQRKGGNNLKKIHYFAPLPRQALINEGFQDNVAHHLIHVISSCQTLIYYLSHKCLVTIVNYLNTKNTNDYILAEIQSTLSKVDTLAGPAPTVCLREVSALEGDEVND